MDGSDLKKSLSAGLSAFHCQFLDPAEDIIQRVFDEVPHLIVIDEDFNEGEGRKLALRIRQDLILKFIPIVLLSNHGGLGARDPDSYALIYCSKKYEPKDIIRRICQTLETNVNELDLNPLTHLPGSRSTVLKIERAVHAKQLFTVCCVDLSDLDAFNTAYGDARGDEVIIGLSKIIAAALKTQGSQDDFLGHLGGDDFVIVTAYDHAAPISEAVIHDFDAQVHQFYDPTDSKNGYLLQRNQEGFLTHYPIMNVSVVIMHDDNRPLSEVGRIGRIAGTLKKYAKTLPGSYYIKYHHCFPYQDSMKAGELLEVQFPNKMKSIKVPAYTEEPDKYSAFFNAILSGEMIESAYQPIVDLGTMRVIGYEALTRIYARDFTMQPVLLFSIARESGKVKELDTLCIDAALRSAQKLDPDKKIFLNLNLETLIDHKLMKQMFSKKNAIEFRSMVIEVTEQSLLRSFEKVRDALFELKEQGVLVAIDDMGGGAVSLRDMAVLKPDYVKFDRSLIRQIDSNSTKQQIALSLILFANGIHALTTAEGIETKEELETVRSLGMTLGQGYYFAKPGKAFPKVHHAV